MKLNKFYIPLFYLFFPVAFISDNVWAAQGLHVAKQEKDAKIVQSSLDNFQIQSEDGLVSCERRILPIAAAVCASAYIASETANKYETKRLERIVKLNTLHVSCRSDRPKLWEGDKDLGGIILYQNKGETDWYCNGIHCKSGYIIVREINKIKNVYSSEGQIHGQVYKSVFKEEINTSKVVGGGFSYRPNRNPKWKFNSWTMNAPNGKDAYHDGKKEMNENEIKVVTETLKNWIKTGQQNYDISSFKLGFYKDPRYHDYKYNPNESLCTLL